MKCVCQIDILYIIENQKAPATAETYSTNKNWDGTERKKERKKKINKTKNTRKKKCSSNI